jgi:hypothetical protein
MQNVAAAQDHPVDIYALERLLLHPNFREIAKVWTGEAGDAYVVSFRSKDRWVNVTSYYPCPGDAVKEALEAIDAQHEEAESCGN